MLDFRFKGNNSNNLCSSMLNHNESPEHAQHIIEFREMAIAIAQEQINLIVPSLVEESMKRVCTEIINSVMRAIEYDITTVLQISFSDLNSMFTSQKARKFVSDTIIREIKKSLNNIEIKISF